MRRFLFLVVLLVVVALTSSSGVNSALAFTMCTTTCPFSHLSCNATTCSSVAGQYITCDGVTTTCATADEWCACTVECTERCETACSIGPALCQLCVNNCGCGPVPPNLAGCP
jgi:hypothetical protein